MPPSDGDRRYGAAPASRTELAAMHQGKGKARRQRIVPPAEESSSCTEGGGPTMLPMAGDDYDAPPPPPPPLEDDGISRSSPRSGASGRVRGLIGKIGTKRGSGKDGAHLLQDGSGRGDRPPTHRRSSSCGASSSSSSSAKTAAKGRRDGSPRRFRRAPSPKMLRRAVSPKTVLPPPPLSSPKSGGPLPKSPPLKGGKGSSRLATKQKRASGGPKSKGSKGENSAAAYKHLIDDGDDGGGPADCDEGQEEPEDPLVSLFHAHNTQRVRFNLAGSESAGGSDESVGSESGDDIGCDVGGNCSPKMSPKALGGKTPSFNIKSFMKRNLFGGSSKSTLSSTDDEDGEVGDALDGLSKEEKAQLQKQTQDTSPKSVAAPAVLRTKSLSFESLTDLDSRCNKEAASTFEEDPAARAEILRLVGKAKRAQTVQFRYEYAIRYYLRAMKLLQMEGYPDSHPRSVSTLQSLNDAHHAVSSLKNSANIVKMGIRHEDDGELVKALKMYTIAYRIRRESLGVTHPSLAVLLNMLGSVQVKRDELHEAMQIYELALYGRPDDNRDIGSDGTGRVLKDPLTLSVTLRDMGIIYERWGDDERALELYRESLDCVSHLTGRKSMYDAGDGAASGDNKSKGCFSLDKIKLVKSFSGSPPKRMGNRTPSYTTLGSASSLPGNAGAHAPIEEVNEEGEMEVYLDSVAGGAMASSAGTIILGNDDLTSSTAYYDSFFPPQPDDINQIGDKKKPQSKDGSSKSFCSESEQKKKKVQGLSDVDVAMTLHQIAQIYRRQLDYNTSCAAYRASLRGMKRSLGKNHSNVAAILANLGNLHKEMGDNDEAYAIYKEVLCIETQNLGLSHPEVVVTLHNIATIEAARGEHSNAIAIYRQVLSIQKKLYGKDHVTIALTSACMGDSYERMGEFQRAMNAYEEALRVRTSVLGREDVEVGRLLAKLGKMSGARMEYRVAGSYLQRALVIYRLNRLEDDHPWVQDAMRDAADMDAALALGGGRDERFEC